MPIKSIGSWLPAIDEFIAHWIEVNAFLGPPGFKLGGPYALAEFISDRAAIAAAIAAVKSFDTVRNTARSDRDLKRAAIKARMIQFNNAVRGQLAGSRYIPNLPKPPGFSNSPGVWRDVLENMLSLWQSVNKNNPPVEGFSPPLTLSGGYEVADCIADKLSLDVAFSAVNAAELKAQQTRNARDSAFAPVYQRMKQYRLAVKAALPPGNPLLDTIPAITTAPGVTPKAAIMAAVWNEATSKVDLNWVHPDPTTLTGFEIRYHPGPQYKTAEEQLVGSVGKEAATFSTDYGLAASGSLAMFKVYALNGTRYEKGSNAVKILRP